MFWRRFILVAFVIVFAASPIRALELSSFPTELTLTPSEAGFVAVRVTASGDSPVAGLQLNPYAPEDLKPELVKAPAANSLSAGGAAVWIYRLRRKEGGSRLGSVLWRLDGVEQRNGSSTPVVATAVTKVTASATPSAVAELSLRAGFEMFHDLRGADIYILIENKTGSEIVVERLIPYHPSFMDVQLVNAKLLPLTVSPGSLKSVAYTISANAVKPGTHTLLWEADLKWSEGGRPRSGTLVVSKDVPVGMLGQSELLTALKIPSLLLLPGILILATIHWLRAKVYPRPTQGEALKIDAAEFLFLAATLSLLATFVYPLVTRYVFGDPRNFVVLAGFRDIVNLWWGSLGAGFTAWAVWYGGGRLIDKAEQLWMQKPYNVLKKLKGEPTLLRRKVRFEEPGGGSHEGLVLFERRGQMWLAPKMVVEYEPTSEERINEAIKKGPKALLDALKESGATVTWKASEVGMIEKPCMLDRHVQRESVGTFDHPLVVMMK